VSIGTTRNSSLIARSSRLGYRLGLTGLVVLLGCESLQTVVADGDTRTITMNHTHRTNDTITVTFKRNGRYDDDGLGKLNHFLRDWRNDEQTKMDPRLFDLVWEVQNEFGGNKTINIISSYRSPQTNSMLRRRSNGVAKFSQHMLGKAMDFNINGVPLEELRAAGLRLQRGGVGFYPSSGSPFVHLDVGSVRHWPRMTHDQLAKVFPNGRTVHVPTDGRPLPGYELALADLQKRGNSPSSTVLASAGTDPAAGGSKFLSKLLGFGKSDDDEDGETTSASGRADARRPAGGTTVASAEPKLLESKFGDSKLTGSKFGENKLPDSKLPESKLSEAKPVSSPTAKPQVAQAPQANPAPKPAPGGFQLASAGPSKIVPAPSRPAQAASLVARAAQTPNDIIRARGFWEGLPEAAPAPRPVAARPQKFQVASVEKTAPVPEKTAPETDTTASVTPWPVATANDRVAPELALSYAATPSQDPATSTSSVAPMGTGVSRGGALTAAAASAARSTTVAVKGNEQPALTERSLVAHAAARFARQENRPVDVPAAKTTNITANTRILDPWLRAIMVTPDAQRFMSTTLFGMPDFRNLRPLMQKPASAVMMTFSQDPNPGLETSRFTGTAVVFMSTVSFGNRTAMLQP
jgi:uncharacterized protein YcbK (DUF882 family)